MLKISNHYVFTVKSIAPLRGAQRKERKRMCKIYFRNLSWVWGVDRKIQACRWCKTMISRDGYFDLPVPHERFFFLHTLHHIWSQIPLIVDIFHILITFLWCLMTALTSVMLTLTTVYLLIPIQPVHIKSVRNLNFYLTLDNFSFSVSFYNHAIFQYMYLNSFWTVLSHKFRHSRQVYIIHSGLQNEGPQVII